MFYTFYTAIKKFYTAIKMFYIATRRAPRRLVRSRLLGADRRNSREEEKRGKGGARRFRDSVRRPRQLPSAHQQQPCGNENRRAGKRKLCQKVSHFIRWL